MRYLIVVTLVLSLAGAAWAADEAASPKVSLDLKDADITEALQEISQKGQVTVLGDASVKGKVTASLNEMTPEQALDTICRLNKLSWVKVYVATREGEKPSASKVFALLDALKALGGKAVILEDQKAESHTLFVPNARPGEVEVPAIASQLGLKPVYLVRVEPDPNAPKEEKATRPSSGLAIVTPPTDPKLAANEVWTYFSQMTTDQRFQVMREIGQMMRENMTPEDRENMRRMWEERRRQWQEQGGRPPGPGGPPGGPGFGPPPDRQQ